MTPPKTLSRPLAQRVGGLESSSEATIFLGRELPENVIQAAVDALDRGETHYTDRPGIPEFRQWVAGDLNERYDLDIDPKEVTITCGSTEARFVSITLLAQPGSAVWCPGEPEPIHGAAHLAGAELLRSVKDAADVSVLYLGTDDEPQVIAASLQQMEAVEGWIVWDMSVADGYPEEHPAQNPKLTERVITIGGPPEYFAGWRVGWMAGSEAALRLRAGKQAITICTTNVSQWTLLEYYRTRTWW